MISEAVEARMSEARRRANAQDREHPFLINIDDGRLVPNVPRLAGQAANKALGKAFIPPHPKYRVYMGPPKAKLEERMRILMTQGLMARAAVIDTNHLAGSGNTVSEAEKAEAFNINRAGREELVVFAQENYGVAIDNASGDTHVMKLRAKVRELARAAGDLPKPGAGDPPDPDLTA